MANPVLRKSRPAFCKCKKTLHAVLIVHSPSPLSYLYDSLSPSELQGPWSNLSKHTRSAAIAHLMEMLTARIHPSRRLQFPSYAIKLVNQGKKKRYNSGEVAELANAVLQSAAACLLDEKTREVARGSWWFDGGSVFDPVLGAQPDVLDAVSDEWDEEKSEMLFTRWMTGRPTKWASSNLRPSAGLNFWCAMRILSTLCRCVLFIMPYMH